MPDFLIIISSLLVKKLCESFCLANNNITEAKMCLDVIVPLKQYHISAHLTITTILLTLISFIFENSEFFAVFVSVCAYSV